MSNSCLICRQTISVLHLRQLYSIFPIALFPELVPSFTEGAWDKANLYHAVVVDHWSSNSIHNSQYPCELQWRFQDL